MNENTGSSQNQTSGGQNEEVLMVLKNLAEICHTGHEGYTTAAESIQNPEYASLFNSFAQQRRSFEEELKQAERRLGGNPENEGGGGLLTDAAGALHRGWINLKSAITGGKDHAILEECERGEDAAVAAYKDAMEKQLPQDVAQMVRQQYKSVQEAHVRVRSLRDAVA